MDRTFEDIQPHSLQKHEMLRRYMSMFATSMKYKFKHRVYIDLFAGCGEAKIENQDRTFPTSPMLSLSIPDPFTRYIFCEISEKKARLLEERVQASGLGADVRIIQGDVNRNVHRILENMPPKYEKVLTFCVIDPYNLGSLKFATLEQLAHGYRMDMLILVATHYDGNRNLDLYLKPDNPTIDELLGDSLWRENYDKAKGTGGKFGRFLISEFMTKMHGLGYLKNRLDEVQTIRISGKQVKLYDLTFFTHHELGKKFWRDARKSQDNNLTLEFDE